MVAIVCVVASACGFYPFLYTKANKLVGYIAKDRNSVSQSSHFRHNNTELAQVLR